MSKYVLGKTFVTGADGFIGSHLVERLLELGHEVTALCLYNSQGSHGWLETLSKKPPKNLKLVFGDVRDPFFVESSIDGHATVFHLASLIAIPYSYVAPQSYVETNITGALNVANAARKAKVGRVVHTSTSEVYGTALFTPISEKHPLQGQSPYSASKIGADVLMESYHRSFDLPVTTLRPFNTYGPRQSMRAVLPTVVAQALSPERRVVVGNTGPTRDFNYVGDTVEAFIALAERGGDESLGQVFNAGSGVDVTIAQAIEMIAEIVGYKLDVVVDESRFRPEKSEVNRLQADANRLRQLTGWTHRVTLEQGLAKLVDWTRQSAVATGTKYWI